MHQKDPAKKLLLNLPSCVEGTVYARRSCKSVTPLPPLIP